MDPFTLAYLAGHSDISITKRYVHPEGETIKAAMTLLKGFAELRGFKLPPSTFRTVDECSVPPILRSM